MSSPIDDAKSEVSAAFKARQGPPAKDADEAAAQVAQLRAAMGRDIDALRGKVPDSSDVAGQAKSIGGAVGAGSLVLAALGIVLKKRSSRRAEEERVRVHAMALARELARLDLDPEDVVEDDRGGVLVKVAAVVAALAAIAGAIVALRQRMQGDDVDWTEAT